MSIILKKLPYKILKSFYNNFFKLLLLFKNDKIPGLFIIIKDLTFLYNSVPNTDPNGNINILVDNFFENCNYILL